MASTGWYSSSTANESGHCSGHVSHVRGSRTLTRTQPVKAGTPPGSLTDEELLSFLLEALRPWIER